MNNSNLAEYTARLKSKYSLNKKVLFVQSLQFLFESLNLEVIKNRGYYAYPPTGLQHLVKALAGRDLEIKILDLNYQFLKRVISDNSFKYENWLDILDEYLDDYQPSVVGVTSISVYGDVFKAAFPLTAILERLRKRDDCLVVAGGATVTNETANYLKGDFCHFVIEGEGENKINYLFDSLFDCQPNHKATPDIYFMFNEKIEQTNGEKDIVKMEGDLVETYKLVDIEDYCQVGCTNPFSRMAGQDKPFTGIQLHRGCRANCKFCDVSRMMGLGLRQYNVEDILADINYLVKKRNIRHFEILDDDFLGASNFKDGIMAVLKELVKLRQEFDITWSAGNGLIAASLTDEILTLIRDSGCVGFRIGIESGNAQMQKQMKKPANLTLLRRVGRTLQKYPEIFMAGNYIIGFFGTETFGQMLDTFKFSLEMNLDGASFSAFQFTGESSIKEVHGNRRIAAEFIPSKDSSRGEILVSKEVVSGPAIFNLPKNIIPSPEQIKEIWFAFNLVANYIDNKNLKPGGHPKKFAAWLNALQLTYPKNSYMPLFAALCYVLTGENKQAAKQLAKVKSNLADSGYWRNRLRQFGLVTLLNNFPNNAVEWETARVNLLGNICGAKELSCNHNWSKNES